MTDVAVFVILAVTFAIGWMKGFLRSIIGPLGLVFCLYLSFDYLHKTHNAGMAFSIAFFGPIVLSIAAGFLIKMFFGGSKPGTASRVGGGLLNVSWMGAMVLISLALILIIPLPWQPFELVQSDIKSSFTFKLMEPWVKDYLPKENKAPVAYGPPGTQQKKFEAVQSTAEYKDLMSEPRIKAVLEDDKLIEEIREKKFGALMNDPRIVEIMQDPKVMKKFLRFYQNVPMEGLNGPKGVNVPEVKCAYNIQCSDLDCGGFETGGKKFDGLCVNAVCECVCGNCE